MKKTIKRAAAILTAAALFLTGCSWKEKTDMVSKEGFFFDTIINIAVSSDKGEALLEHCFSMCAEYENIFSRTKESSELYQVNHRTQQEITVSEDFYALLEAADTYYRLTEGRFDITIAPLLDIWDFKGENPQIPSEEAIAQAASKVDFSQVQLEGGNTVLFKNPEVMLDFGALAKGYIADGLKEYLVSQGVTKGLINLGGNVLTIGEKEKDKAWKVGIQKPFGEEKEIISYVESSDGSVVSSGIYERYFKLDNQLYHHVLNSRTGYPAETDLAEVTILSRKSLEGDGLSTSCLLLGYEEAKKMLSSMEDVGAVFVLRDGSVKTTDGVKLREPK